MSFHIGDKIGPYRLVERLGQGGIASVYRAYHEALDRYVAIKILHPAFATDATFLRRFQREARVVAQLDHPHIVPVYDFAEHEGHPYLVMRLIEGETLKDILGRGMLTRAEILPITGAIASALDYAHARGVLHRDIKPSNIILSQEGKIIITDFGLARLAETGESTLSQDVMLGTPQYISPEQARGDPRIDERADVYSFGVVMYEMVCGQVPFQGDTFYTIIHDHIFTPPPDPAQINPRVSPALAAVLRRALSKSPEERYASAGTLAVAFRQALLATTTEVAPPERRERSPVDVVAIAPTVAEPARTPPPIEAQAGATPSPHSRRRTLLLVLLGMALGMCLCLGLVAVSNGINQNQAEATAAAATVAPAPTPVLLRIPAPEQLRAPNQLLALVQAAPDDLALRLELAAAYLQAGNNREVLQLLETTFAGTNDPNPLISAAQAALFYPAYYDLAHVILLLGLRQFADDPTLSNLMMIEVILADRGATAVADLMATIQARPDSTFTVQLGEAYQAYKTGNSAAAMRIVNQALREQSNPVRAEFLFLQGILYREMNEPQRARQTLQAALTAEDTPLWLRTHIQRLLNTL